MLNAFYKFFDTLFSVPDCMWDSQCYKDEDYYCKAICDKNSPEWYGDCPDESGCCSADDLDCVKCFGDCWMFQCWYDAWRGPRLRANARSKAGGRLPRRELLERSRLVGGDVGGG